MKKYMLLLAVVFGGICALHAQTPTDSLFHFYAYTELTYDKTDPQLAPLAEYLTQYIGIAEQRESEWKNSILLACDSTLSAESFRLTVRPDRIEIVGGDYGGVFNGIQRLFELLPAEIYTRKLPLPFTIASQTITESPKFAYRGMMLDVARTWLTVPQIERYIDLLAYQRINKLHLHLTDDEGWRIEIKSHPELAETGGFRGGDSPIPAIYGKWHEKYGGYYTQEELRDLVAYAAVRNIEIIPEIELLGHSRAIAAVHPEILCNFQADTAATHGLDTRNVWCVAREDNYKLIKDILDEVSAIFPSRYIHIGGDEVDVSQWAQCPDCQALMQRDSLTDAHQLEDLFIKRVDAILETDGKQPAVWDEAAMSGDLIRDAQIYGWESTQACQDATAKGYKTVVMPGQYFYFDMRQSRHEDGATWAAIFDASKVFDFDFDGFTPEQMQNVVGLEGTFFSEISLSHNPETPDYLDYMCFPRICALAHIAWYGNDMDWDTYYKRLVGRQYDRMAAMGIRFRLFPPRITYTRGEMGVQNDEEGKQVYARAMGTLTATMNDGSTIYYMTRGDTIPQLYTEPIRTDEPWLYRFKTEYKTGRSPWVSVKSYYRTIKPAVTISTSMGENADAPLSGASQYADAALTARTCTWGDWVGYTFDTPIACREMLLQTGYASVPCNLIPDGYAEISCDGTTFEKAGALKNGGILLHPDRPVKAVRLVATCNGNGTSYVVIQPPRIKPEM